MNAYLYTSSRAMHSEILNLLLPPVRLLSKRVLLLMFADVCRTSTFAVLTQTAHCKQICYDDGLSSLSARNPYSI